MSERTEEHTTPMDTEPTPLTLLAKAATSRRRFLVGGSAAAAGLALAACGDDDEEPEQTGTTEAGEETTTTGEEGGAQGDLAVASFAASLEVLAVNTYEQAGEAATGGALGEVPPAVVEFVITAQMQHQEALDAWNGVLEGAGEPAVSEPPEDLSATVEEQFGQVTDVTGAAELALMLEQIAAATYLDVIPALEGQDAVALAGSILPIDMQHAAVLLFVLGQYPVPDVFASTDESVAPA